MHPMPSKCHFCLSIICKEGEPGASGGPDSSCQSAPHGKIRKGRPARCLTPGRSGLVPDAPAQLLRKFPEKKDTSKAPFESSSYVSFSCFNTYFSSLLFSMVRVNKPSLALVGEKLATFRGHRKQSQEIMESITLNFLKGLLVTRLHWQCPSPLQRE